jgi:small subunit ribosomal protein S3
MASQIERRFPYRRIMKQTLSKVMQNKEAQGVKVMLKGRLNGAEIARREWLKEGRIPLQTLRSDIDYAQATAYTTYGTIGITVWIYKGEVF